MEKELIEKARRLLSESRALRATIMLFDKAHEELAAEAEKSGDAVRIIAASLQKLAWLQLRAEKLDELQKIAEQLNEVREELDSSRVEELSNKLDWNAMLKEIKPDAK